MCENRTPNGTLDQHVSAATRSCPAFHQPQQAKTISGKVKLSSALMEFDASRYGLQVWNKREKLSRVSLTTLNLGSSPLLQTVSPHETIAASLDITLRWNIYRSICPSVCHEDTEGECHSFLHLASKQTVFTSRQHHSRYSLHRRLGGPNILSGYSEAQEYPLLL